MRICNQTQIQDEVVIHNNVYIGRYCDIGRDIVLEENVTLSDYVCILGDTHDYSDSQKRAGSMYSLGEKRIGRGAWIGYRSFILPQVRYIGKGAIIGAGSIVTKDVPDNSIYAGNPAKFLSKIEGS